MSTETNSIDIDRNVGNFFYNVRSTRDAGVGLTEKTIDYIVDVKKEPEWLREFRKNAYRVFNSKPLPTHWAGDELKEIDFDVIRYYLASGGAAKKTWEEVPEDIKRTFERLGIPESERKFLAGVEAQFDSEAVYSNIKKAVADQGVIFMGSTDALKERPELFRKWFGSDSDRGQQIQRVEQRGLQRRQLHLRAAWSEGETSAPGLFPDQRGEFRAVRADFDHSR